MESQRKETKDRIEVLTCTASEYVESVDRKLADYTFRGVRCSDVDDVYNCLSTDASNFGTEVITDLKPHKSIIYATALIPKSHILG